MEHGFLSQNRGGGRGVKEKHNGLGTKVVNDYGEMSLVGPTFVTTDVTAARNRVTSIDIPSNITNISNPSPETTGQDTSGLSVVQTGIPTEENTRSVSYINVVPTELVTPAGNGVVLFTSLVTNEAVTNMVVENYVKNAWKKFGLVRVMINSKGFFFLSLLQLRMD
ncbi:hypothetical protein Tco_1232936 [Tanacetum coccineum]